MATLVRLVCWIPERHQATFTHLFQERALPSLEWWGLALCEAPSNPRKDAFVRHFELKAARHMPLIRRGLAADPQWVHFLEDAGRLLALDSGRVDYALAICRTPAGPGTVIEAGAGSQQGLWQLYNSGDGLPGVLLDGLEDREGNLWFASQTQGACRFDGAQVQHYTAADGLADDWITCLLQDGQGRLWFGTAHEGVSCFDGEFFRTYSTVDGLGDERVNCLCEDGRGRLWIGTRRGGLSCFDGEFFRTYGAADGLADDWVTCVLEDGGGRLWIGTRYGGLSCFDGQSFRTYTAADGLTVDWVTCLLQDGQGRLWIGTHGGGLNCLDGESLRTYGAAQGLMAGWITCLAEDSQGRLWIGTRMDGVSVYDGRQFTAHTARQGLANDQVYALVQDRKGYMWVVCYAGGVSRYDQVQFATFQDRDDLPSNGIMDIDGDGEGGLWIGTWHGPVHYDGRRFAPLARLQGRNTWAVLHQRSGAVWFGTYEQGLYCLRGDALVHYTEADGLGHYTVTCLIEDRQGRVWAGTNGGLSCVDGSSVRTYTTADGLPENLVRTLLEDREGRLWVGMEAAGLCRFDGRSFHTYTAVDGLGDNHVRALAEDEQGRLWVGTEAGGLSCFDGERFRQYTAADGLPDNHIVALCPDGEGRLWVGTFGGGAACFDGLVFQQLSKRDGLANDVVQAVYRDGEGQLYFGTEGGITRYRPLREATRVALVGVMGDRRYEAGEEVRLTTAQKVVVFEFRGSSPITGMRHIAYCYRLRGRQEQWQVARNTQVQFHDLQEGTYVFQVRAADRDLNYSELAEVRVVVEADLREQHIDELEERVLERTRALERANRELEEARSELERRVAERTAELSAANERLRREIAGRRDLERQLFQAQKMEALGQMAGGVAHDFNNLLTGILGNADLATERLAGDAEGRELLEEICQAGERAAHMTRQLLAFSRQQILQPRVIELADLVADLARMLRRLISENIDMTLDLAPDAGRVRADPHQLEQVVINLVVNARDAMPGGGRLFLEVGNERLGAADLRGHPGAEAGPYVRLRVRDTGTGMDAQTLERIFEPFFTTKPQGKGTGLGLATVHGIVIQSRGFIDVESRRGRGTTFSVYLPRIEDAVEEVPAETSRQAVGGSETVLLVEDEPSVRDLVKRILRSKGYRVLEAQDGEEALALFGEHGAEIDLVLTDLVMPVMGGIELSERVRRERPQVRVLYMSGYTNAEALQREIVDRGMPFLQKPFDADRLAARVRETLEGPGPGA